MSKGIVYLGISLVSLFISIAVEVTLFGNFAGVIDTSISVPLIWNPLIFGFSSAFFWTYSKSKFCQI